MKDKINDIIKNIINKNQTISQDLIKKANKKEEEHRKLMIEQNEKFLKKIEDLKREVQEEKQKFISQKKKEFSIVFNCPESKILITNLRSGSINYDFRREPTNKELEKIEKDKAVKDIRMARLIDG